MKPDSTLLNLAEDIRKEAKANYFAVGFNYTQPKKINIMKLVAGLNFSEKSIMKTLGIVLEDQEFPFKKGTITYKILHEGKTQVNDDLFTQFDFLVPKKIANFIQKSARIKRIIDVPIKKGNEVLGEAIFLFSKLYPVENIDQLEKLIKSKTNELLKFR